MKASRRLFLGGAAAMLGLRGGLRPPVARAQAGQAVPAREGDLLLVNGRIHTMDPGSRVVSQVLIRGGRFAGVGNAVAAPAGVTRVDLGGRTVIPGLIDAHNHIVLVGNRPGWHTPLVNLYTMMGAYKLPAIGR
jgi:hypothetical protein